MQALTHGGSVAGDPDALPNDPFSGETNGIPDGLQVPTGNLAVLLGVPNPAPFIGLNANRLQQRRIDRQRADFWSEKRL